MAKSIGINANIFQKNAWQFIVNKELVIVTRAIAYVLMNMAFKRSLAYLENFFSHFHDGKKTEKKELALNKVSISQKSKYH